MEYVTQEQLAALLAKTGKGKSKPREKSPDGMNKLEREFYGVLRLELAGGKLKWVGEHDSVTLKLADDTRYTPDFPVLTSDDQQVFYEVKGHWRDDARVKIKVASALFPWLFVAVTKVDGKWSFEIFN